MADSDADRFTAIYDGCRQRVWAYVVSRAGRHVADDVVNETYPDSGARPATKADEVAWRADGSPTSWKLSDAPDETVTYAGRGEIEHDAPGGKADSGPYGEVPLRLLPTLPTDTKALRERLFALVDKDHNGPKRVLDRIVVNSAIELATSLPSSPALRAAAYRLLAAEPGVRSLGDVKDHTGRAGHAVALPSPYASAPELRLIFDKSTGMPLGTETVATRSGDGAREGETLSYTTITSMQWTDEAPPFDTDTPDPGPETPSDRRDGPSRCARAVHGGGTSSARGGTTSGSTGSRQLHLTRS